VRVALLSIGLTLALAASAHAAPSWHAIGGPVAPAASEENHSAQQPTLATLSGAPHVAWVHTTTNSFTIRAGRHTGPPFDASAWTRLPGSPDANAQTGGSNQPDMAVVNGSLQVAWVEGDFTDQQARVARFDNANQTWSYVGAIGPGVAGLNHDVGDDAFVPSIADVGGVPHVAWYERADECCDLPTVHVKRFNGTSWVELGSDPNGVGIGSSPDIVNIGGVPYVAYTDTDDDGGANGGSGWVVTVKRYDANTNSWIQVGSGPNPISTYSDKLTGPPILEPTIAAVGSTPYVAFKQPTGSGSVWQVRVKRFNGTSWEQPAASPSSLNIDTSRDAGPPSIHAVGGSQPHVAWAEFDGTNQEVRVRRFNGSSWAQLGSGASPINRSSTRHALEVDMGSVGSTPVIAWAEIAASTNVEVHASAFADTPQNTARPQVTGTPQVGSQLSCSNGTWDAGTTHFVKTWERAPRSATSDNDPAWAAINNASGNTYTVQADDAGSRVRCRVVASNAALSSEAVSLSKRTDHGRPQPLAAPVVSGSPIAGSEMTCEPPGWQNSPDLTYQWVQNGFPISGANQQKFSYPDSPTVDYRLSCRVTGTNDIGSFTSDPSNIVHVVGSTPRRSQFPEILFSGFFPNPVGARAECQGFAFTHDYGQHSYEWRRNGAPIQGANERVYITTVDDLGRELTCHVTGSNPKGVGETMDSRNRVVVPLPRGSVGGRMSRAGGRNEFDPVNFLAITDDFRAAIEPLIVERLQRAVATETERCRAAESTPKRAPIPDAVDFPDPLLPLAAPNRLGSDRCGLLVHAPELIAIGPFGVHYIGPAKYVNSRTKKNEVRPCGEFGKCPDLGFRVPPVDPTKTSLLDADLLQAIEPVVPERVLWDVDNDGRTDVECPGSSPVLRTMLDKGKWEPRAVIVSKTSAATGVYASVGDSFFHPTNDDTSEGKQRPAQAFVCRTSVDPPPDPKQSPCLTDGTIGRVKLKGNFCPIYLRAIPPDELKGLPPDVYAVIKTMADRLATARRRSDLIQAPPTRINAAQAGPFTDPSLRRTSATTSNTISSLMATSDWSRPSVAAIRGTTREKLISFERFEGLQDRIPFLKQDAGNFALDEIYWSKPGEKVTVNGTEVIPNKSNPTLLVPTDVKNALDSSGFSAMTINTPDAATVLGGIDLATGGSINARLPDVRSTATAVLRDQLNLKAVADELSTKARNVLGPFKLTGLEADVKLQNDGTAILTVLGELPIFTDEKGNKFNAKLTLKGDLEGNLELQGLEFRAPSAKLGPVELSDLFFRYDNGFTVRGKILFPPGRQGIDVRNFELHANGEFKGLDIAYLAGAGSGIKIAPGIFLTKIGGNLTLGPPITKFGLSTTVSVGPSPTGGGCATAGLDTDGDVIIGGQPDVLVTVRGQVQLVCIPVGDANFRAGSDGLVTFDANFHKDEGKLRLTGRLDAKIQASRDGIDAWQASIEGDARLRDFPIFGSIGIGAKAAISNIGFAVCGIYDPPFLPAIKAGGAINFPGGRPPLNQVEIFANLRLFTGCDLSKYKPLGKRNVITGAQAGGTGFTVPSAPEGLLLSLEGAGDAPRVRLRSPSGKEYDFTNAGEGVTLSDAYGQVVESEDRTVVIFGKVEPGQWTAIPAEGSPAVNRVEFSRVLPEPKVSGKVSGKGASRVLSYSAPKQEGQVVRFVEDAPDGRKILGTVKGGGKGSIRYTTGEATGTSRTILAEIEQDGLPRTTLTIAKYSAPNPTVGRPKVKVRRSGSKAIVTWGRAALANSYAVTVTGTDGSRQLLLPPGGAKASKVTVRDVGKKVGLTVRVVATSPKGREGKAGVAKLAKPKAKKKKRKR
jgi:hypothetical protein